MELTDKKIHLLARLSRDRGLYAECKGADLDGLQELGLLEWFDTALVHCAVCTRSASTAESAWYQWQDYACIGPVENWRELVGPEVSAQVDAIDEIEWAVTGRPSTSGQVNSRQVKRGG
jgi:hypothetical protein